MLKKSKNITQNKNYGGNTYENYFRTNLQQQHFPERAISDKNADYKIANDTISEMLDVYKEKFPNEQYQQVEQLLEVLSEVRDIESSHTFCYGFKLATLIMIEVFSSKNELIKG